jgi:DNA-binding SARP family transcriptional activator
MLAVRLFGRGTASYFDRPIDGFPNHQSYLLFCYLLLNRQHKQNRERLASVFWGNYNTSISLKYLRNALWKLRTDFQSMGAELENYLQVNDDNVAFQRSSPYQLDIETFETLTASSRNIPAKELNLDQALQLQQAVELYDGDLLEGVDEEWCLYERERLSLLHLNALTKLMLYHRNHQNYINGLDYGERILKFDNTRENIHREMMILYWLSGEPQMALVQYHQCEQILHDQMGVEPTEDTQELYQQMLHQRYEPPRENILSKISFENQKSVPYNNLTEYTIHEIHHLQQVIQETNTELHRLEELIKQARIPCE